MEEKHFKRTTVTAALPYANGGVHIGHLAGVYVPADIYVRYLRLRGEDVRFICGSDEHGVPITIRAKKEGITPQAVVDRYHAMIKKSFEDFGISFDIYSRTTSAEHTRTASDFFRKLYDDGKLIERETEQYYDEEAHQFLADRYITGECPHCHNPKAYGDQCEKCGSDLDWGIPVPVSGAEGKVLYVWFDAPIGYISNTKELMPDDWQKWWQDPETRLVHFIGKDNIVFHCIVFPSMLKAHGGYILPDNVPANEFLNLENDKISTSRNWAVWLHDYLVEMPGKQDVMRYVLTANAPETKDNNFTWRDFQDRNNNELVAVYGNFVNRALQLTKKYWDGVVPACGELTDTDRQALAEFSDVKQRVEAQLDAFKFRDAQKEAMNLARIGNRYITECEPWKVWKTDPVRVETILYVSLQIVANLAIAFEPFLPFSSARLRKMINMDGTDWNSLGSTDLLRPGHKLGEPELLFEKIDDEAIEYQLQKLADAKRANEAAAHKADPVKATVDFADFEKIDIRVGHIKACEKVKKANKLLKFTIDDGSGRDRTIVSGIAKFYEPEELVGKDVLFIANLAPRKLMGIESEGLILSAENFDGSLSVTTTLRTVSPGSKVC